MKMKRVQVVLAVAAVMLVTSFAVAEMTTQGTIGGSQQPAPWADQTTLYDQTDNWGGNLGTAQDFEAAYDVYDSEGADDFVVTWADGWNVEQVGIIAGYWNGTGPASSIDVVFYSDASGMPGSAMPGCSLMNSPYTDDGAGNFLIDFSGTPCFLPTGTYWVGIQGNLDFASGGQFGYGYRSVQNGAGAMWRNPGDGFGSGCTSWGSVATCITGGPDYCFAILGENAQPGPTPTPPPAVNAEPVPSLNTYGIIAMVVLLIGVAVLVMWRRS